MARNGMLCADVPLRNYSINQSMQDIFIQSKVIDIFPKLAILACWQCGVCVLYQIWFKYLLQSLRSTHFCFRPSFDDVTRINFRFRLLVMWSSPRRRDASSHIHCNLVQDIFILSKVIVIFPKFKMAATAILDFQFM